MVDSRSQFKPLLNGNDMKNDMHDDARTPNGDCSYDPDTDSNNNPNPETSTSNSRHAQDKVEGTPTSQPKTSISQARLRANRENARKSTGPKTYQGKAYSRFNALKHGLLSKKIMFTPDGKLQDEGLLELLESLHQKYGRGDVRTELLVEGIVIEYWRHGKALELEMGCLKYPGWTLCPDGIMPNVLRYATASGRALRKNLELLDELQPPSADADAEEDDTDADAPPPQPETSPQAPKAANGLIVVAPEQSAPEPRSESENEAASGDHSTPFDEEAEAA
jgi:hypothetical protein